MKKIIALQTKDFYDTPEAIQALKDFGAWPQQKLDSIDPNFNEFEFMNSMPIERVLRRSPKSANLREDVLPDYSSIVGALEFKFTLSAGLVDADEPNIATSQRIQERKTYRSFSYTDGSSEE